VSLSGSIEDLPLLEILQVVSFCQKTGHLTVRAPEGDAAVVFHDGRVVSGYIWDLPAAEPAAGPREAYVRARIGSILQRLVRLREGEFAFNLTEAVPTALGGRDLSAEMLADGINPEELMLELARQLDEDRRDCAATLEASFTAPEPAADAASPLPAEAASGRGSAEPERTVEPPPTVAPVRAVPPGAGREPHGPVVLIVDDEPDVCRVVGKRLADAGFEIALAAGAGHAGREMQRLAAARRPFLLVVDLGLPSASGSSFRGGLDVVRQSAGLPVPPPVLLMAETIDEKLRGRARRLGVSLLTFKPGLSKLDPAQYEADLRAFADKLARDLLPQLEGRRTRPAVTEPPATAAAQEPARLAALRGASAEIEARPDPDVVAFVLLRAARAFFPRVVLFVLKDDRLRGLSGFGPVAGPRGLDLLARELSVPLDEPSPFADAVVSGAAWAGPLPPDGALRGLVDRIGAHSARQAAVVPLRATHQTIAVVYGDDPAGAPLPAIGPFVEFAERTGHALESSLAARRTAAARA
jgi:CheY-like chemotaxis protein